MTPRRRVVVTGIGLATSLGLGARVTMGRLLAGERGFGPLTLLSPEGYPTSIAAEAPGLDAVVAPPGEVWSRSDKLAVFAAREALAEAALGPDAGRVELVVAASVGGMLETALPLTQFAAGTLHGADAALLACHPTSAPADRVAATCGPFARVSTVCSACSSGALALGLALGRLRRGEADVVLAGGVDALSLLTFAGFAALASLDPEPSRPFDVSRKGLSLGEAAAFLVLERASPRTSGRAIAELAGFAIGCEAHHITQPEESGSVAEAVLREALRDAGARPEDIGYVSAHGTGTPRNDLMEAGVIARVVGQGALVSSQKAQLGHTLSAAGAVEAAVCALALARHVIPPAVSITAPDPALAIRLAGPTAASTATRVAVSNSFGFGGTDTTVVVRAVDADAARDAEAAPAPRRGPMVVTAVSALGPLGLAAGADIARYAVSDPPADVGVGAEDPRATLDPAATRRIDLAGRYVVALAQALGPIADPARTGVVCGSAFGSSDASAAFCARVLARGPRFAPPLEFPNLVPSSPAAHGSIVLGLRGPSLSVADLGVTGALSLVTAIDLLAGGSADAMIAADVEVPSVIGQGLLSPLLSGLVGPRGSGGAALLVEPEALALARGATPLARIVLAETARAGGPGIDVPAPRGRAEVVVAEDADRGFVPEAWRDLPVHVVSTRAGHHEAAAAVGLAAAVARVAEGAASAVLVVASAPGRTGVVLFERP